MRSTLSTEEHSVGTLFSSPYRFRIPDFQRDYSWGSDEATRLLEDIYAALDDQVRAADDTPYFLGTMLLVTSNKKDDAGTGQFSADIVDGQQRLITLTIILAALRDLAVDRKHAETIQGYIAASPKTSDPFRLVLREEDRNLFVQGVQTAGGMRTSTKLRPSVDDPGHARIMEVRRVMFKELRKRTLADQARIFAYLRDYCRLLVIKTDNIDYAYQIFITINDRGRELTVEDIFLAELIGPLGGAQRERFSSIIADIDRYRGERNRKISRGKTFFSHMSASYGASGGKLIDRMRKAIRDEGGPKQFAETAFLPMAQAFLALKGNAQDRPPFPAGANLRLWQLGLLERYGDDDWVASAMLALTREQKNKKELADALGALEAFAHGLMALGCGSAERRRRYLPINAAIRASEGKIPWRELFSFSSAEQSSILRNIAQKLHKEDKTTCKLFLVRLDQYLSQRPPEYYAPFIDTKEKNAGLSVEHILPKGTLVGKDWQQNFPEARHRMVCAEFLGNLTLVTTGDNAQADHGPFADKLALFFWAGEHPFHLTNMIRHHPAWTYDAICQRHATLMAAVTSLWGWTGVIPMPPKPIARRIAQPA